MKLQMIFYYFLQILMTEQITRCLGKKVGKLEIKRRQHTEITSCIIFDDSFALMPSSQMKDIDQEKCTFIYKRNGKEHRKRPIKVLTSEQSLLSILVFEGSQRILAKFSDLFVGLDNKNGCSINLLGYQIQSSPASTLPTSNSQKTIKVDYRRKIKNFIYYDCYQNKDGFIGALICSDNDQTIIGIHQGGRSTFSYGVLFTNEVINQLTAMLRNYIPVERKIPLPNSEQLEGNSPEEDILQNEIFLNQLYQQYQRMLEEFELPLSISQEYDKTKTRI